MLILSPNAGYGRPGGPLCCYGEAKLYSFPHVAEEVLRDFVFDVVYLCPCICMPIVVPSHHMSICNYQLYAVGPQLSQH